MLHLVIKVNWRRGVGVERSRRVYFSPAQHVEVQKIKQMKQKYQGGGVGLIFN